MILLSFSSMSKVPLIDMSQCHLSIYSIMKRFEFILEIYTIIYEPIKYSPKINTNISIECFFASA